MVARKLPLTRETYLRLDFFGKPPEGVDAEYEAHMPPEFRSLPADE